MADENLLQQEVFLFINIPLCLFLPVKCISDLRYNQFNNFLITPTNLQKVFVYSAHDFWQYGYSLLTWNSLNIFLSFSSCLSSFFCPVCVEKLVAWFVSSFPLPENTPLPESPGSPLHCLRSHLFIPVGFLPCSHTAVSPFWLVSCCPLLPSVLSALKLQAECTEQCLHSLVRKLKKSRWGEQ